jgi:hypothetical protein
MANAKQTNNIVISITFPRQGAIKHVSFDINPGSGAKGLRVDKLDPSSKAFCLERAMTRSYPAFMTITFADSLQLPPVELEYYTQHTHAVFCRRLVVCAPKSVSRNPKRIPKKKTLVIEFNDPHSDVWLSWGDDWQPTIAHNYTRDCVS